MEPSKVRHLLLWNDPGSLDGFDAKVRLLVELGIPEERIVYVLHNVRLSKAIRRKSAKEIKGLMEFLDSYGGITLILKRPATLDYDLDTRLFPRVEFLEDLSGGVEDSVRVILCRMPTILSYSVEHMEELVCFSRSFAGLTDHEILKILSVYPNIVSGSKERKLRPRIEFLKQCGFDSYDISRFLIKSLLFLGLSFEKNLAPKPLVKAGYPYRTKEIAMAMGAATRTSSQNLRKVIGLFLNYGFNFEDIMAMSRKQPQILQYNAASLENKMEYVIEEMGRDVHEVLSFPAFLGYNLDKRIKQRYETMKNVPGKEGWSINSLLSAAPEDFSKTKNTRAQENDSSDDMIAVSK